MLSLSRGLSGNLSPAEIAAREASAAVAEERKCCCCAEEFFAALIRQKLDEQRQHRRKTGKFKKEKGKSHKITLTDNGFKLVARFREGEHEYEKTAEWDWRSGKLTTPKCRHL